MQIVNLSIIKDKSSKVVSRAFLVLLAFYVAGCGENMLESLEEKDNVVEATIALDEGKPAKAIELCLDELGGAYKTVYNSYDGDASSAEKAQLQSNLSAALASLKSAGKVSNPDNVASILSSALAQSAGVDMIDVALNLATNDSSAGSASSNPVVALGSAINDNPTQSVLNNMELSLIVLRSIGTANYRSAESYKDSIFQMAHMALFTSSIGDLSSLDTDDALSILAFIESALVSSASTSEDADSEAQASLDQIQSIYDDIGVNPGDSDAQKQQKVQDFLNQ